MSYIIENALAIKFSSLFHIRADAITHLEAPSIGYRQGRWRQHSGHSSCPRPVRDYKHKPCLKSAGKGFETQAESGLHSCPRQPKPATDRGHQQRFTADQTDSEPAREYWHGNDGKPSVITEPRFNVQTHFVR
ncbi:hypothetical protein [Pseudomonas monteilii]|uniref:hypothetical protein n=1 Tax=Pseudomonas monteilii TaxID=76759 RepID=UPI00383A225A